MCACLALSLKRFCEPQPLESRGEACSGAHIWVKYVGSSVVLSGCTLAAVVSTKKTERTTTLAGALK